VRNISIETNSPSTPLQCISVLLFKETELRMTKKAPSATNQSYRLDKGVIQ